MFGLDRWDRTTVIINVRAVTFNNLVFIISFDCQHDDLRSEGGKKNTRKGKRKRIGRQRGDRDMALAQMQCLLRTEVKAQVCMCVCVCVHVYLCVLRVT